MAEAFWAGPSRKGFVGKQVMEAVQMADMLLQAKRLLQQELSRMAKAIQGWPTGGNAGG